MENIGACSVVGCRLYMFKSAISLDNFLIEYNYSYNISSLFPELSASLLREYCDNMFKSKSTRIHTNFRNVEGWISTVPIPSSTPAIVYPEQKESVMWLRCSFKDRYKKKIKDIKIMKITTRNTHVIFVVVHLNNRSN